MQSIRAWLCPRRRIVAFAGAGAPFPVLGKDLRSQRVCGVRYRVLRLNEQACANLTVNLLRKLSEQRGYPASLAASGSPPDWG